MDINHLLKQYGLDLYHPSRLILRETVIFRGGRLKRDFPFIPTLIGVGFGSGVHITRYSDREYEIGDPLFPGEQGIGQMYSSGSLYNIALWGFIEDSNDKYGVEIEGIKLNRLHHELLTVKTIKSASEINRANGHVVIRRPSNDHRIIGLVSEDITIRNSKGRRQTPLGGLFAHYIHERDSEYIFLHLRDGEQVEITSRYLTHPKPVEKGFGSYGVEVYDNLGNVIFNSNASQPVSELGKVYIDMRTIPKTPRELNSERQEQLGIIRTESSMSRLFPNKPEYQYYLIKSISYTGMVITNAVITRGGRAVRRLHTNKYYVNLVEFFIDGDTIHFYMVRRFANKGEVFDVSPLDNRETNLIEFTVFGTKDISLTLT